MRFAYTYDTYGSDPTHPVEFGATDKAQLVGWISGRLGRTVSIPDLAASGYRFHGRAPGCDAQRTGRLWLMVHGQCLESASLPCW